METRIGSLQGKVAVVTGAAQGIGREYALALAAQGCKVAVADILDGSAVVAAIAEQAGEAFFQRTDVTVEADAAQLAAETARRWGGIDILVNNAALYGGMTKRPWDEITLPEFERMLRVNVVGTWLVSKAVVPYMKQRGGGKVVNIASGVHFTAPPNMCNYTASKAAVLGLTRSMARELGTARINVNALSPGLVATEATLAQTTTAYLERSASQRIIQRVQEPGDLIGTLLFLCSDLSDFITGQNILVDGGTSFQ